MKREKRSLPTILITARCDNAIRDRARALGAVALLEKPIDFNGLMAAIGRCSERYGS
jgi:FixJ family two-component response regulator